MTGLELFTLTAKLVLDKSSFDSNVKHADESGKTLSDNLVTYMEAAKKVIGGLFAVGTIKRIASEVWDLTSGAAEVGDKIDKQSQALGLSRRAYQEWDYILGQTGGSIDSMGLAMKTMNEAILGGSEDAADAVSWLGLSMEDLQKMSAEDQLTAIVHAFNALPASTEKSRFAMKLFGRGSQDLMALLNSSAGSVEELRQRASDLGLIMADEDIDAAVAFGDALDDLNRAWDGVKRRLGTAFLQSLANILTSLADTIGRIAPLLENALKTGDWTPFLNELKNGLGGLFQSIGFALGIVDEHGELNIPEWMKNALKLIGFFVELIADIIENIARIFGYESPEEKEARERWAIYDRSQSELADKRAEKAARTETARETLAEEQQLQTWDDYKKALEDNGYTVEETTGTIDVLGNKVEQTAIKIYRAGELLANFANRPMEGQTSAVAQGDAANWAALELTGQSHALYTGDYTFGDYNGGQAIGPKFHAKGLNYVPYDNYLALLHRGETVLNQNQGRMYRSGELGGFDNQALYQAVAGAVAEAVSQIQINMDSQAVGNAVSGAVSRNVYRDALGRRYV